MEESTARTIVKVVAVLHYISAGLALLWLIPVLSLLLASDMSTFSGFDGAIFTLGIMLVIILIIVIILYALIGYGLWNFRKWGRILLLVVAWASVVLMLLSIRTIVRDFAAIGGLLVIVVSAVLIWLFQFNESIKRLFS